MSSRKLEVVFVGDTKNLDKAFGKVKGEAAGLTAKLERTGSRMQGVGKKMSAAVTAPLVGAAAGAAKLAVDFDSSLSKIVGLVGVSRKQVDAWRGDILSMAKELPQSPKELADALFFVTSAGFRGKEALDVLNQSARAAAAGLGSTEVVADAVTSAINAYGAKNLDAAKATDVLTATVREGKASAESLAPVFGKVIPSAQAMGVEFHEVGASLASLTRTGANAAEAATQTRAILSTFMKPNQLSTKALRKMKLSVDDVRKSMAEKGLMPTLMKLRTEAEKNGVEFAKLFPNVRALGGFLALTGEGAKANSEVFAKLKGEVGATDKAFAEAGKTADFQLKTAMSSVQVALVQLGDAILPVVVPALVKLAEWVGKAAQAFTDAPKGMQVAVLGLAAVAAAAGPVLVVLGTIIKSAATVGKALKKLGVVKKALAVVWRVASRIMLLASRAAFGPIGLAITAAIVAGTLLAKHWDKVSAWLAGAWSDMKRAATAAFDAILGVVSSVWDRVRSVTTGVWNTVRSILSGVWSGIEQAARFYFDTYAAIVGAVWSRVRSITTGAWDWLTGFLRGAWEGIATVAKAGWSVIRKAVINPVRSIVSWVADKVEWLVTRWRRGFDRIVGFAKSFASTIKNAVTSAFRGVVNTVIGFINTIIKAINKIPGVKVGTVAKLAVPQSPNGAGGYRKGRGGKAGHGVGPMFDNNDRKGGPVDVAKNIAKAPLGLLEGGAKWLLGKLPGAGALPDWMGGLGKWLLDKVSKWVKGKVGSLFGGGPGKLGSKGGGLSAVTALARSMGLVVTSGYRPGDDGWHGRNRARDYAGPPSAMLAFAQAAAKTFGKRALEIIYTPLGFGVKNGSRVGLGFFGPAVNADHFDHVHVAMAQGGMVRRRVGELGPEDVYLPTGARVVQASESGRGGDAPLIGEVHIHGADMDEDMIARDLAWRLATAR